MDAPSNWSVHEKMHVLGFEGFFLDEREWTGSNTIK